MRSASRPADDILTLKWGSPATLALLRARRREIAAVLGPRMDSGLIHSLSLQVGNEVNAEMLRVVGTLLKPAGTAPKTKKPAGRAPSELDIVLCVRVRGGGGGGDGAEREALWAELDAVV